MADECDYTTLTDEALLGQCEVDTYKSSGPGGQHRNKVSSAVRLRHQPTGVCSQGDESRSQHSNRRQAIRRLRMNIACSIRHKVDISDEAKLPAVVAECIFAPRGRSPEAAKYKLDVGKRDARFWSVAAYLLDVLDSLEGKLADSARFIGISTSNMTNFLRVHRHLWAAAQQIRKAHNLSPIRARKK